MADRKNKFLIKRSNVPGKTPNPGDLALGELALNTADAKLYTSGTTDDSILPIGWDRISRTGDTMTGPLFGPSISATTISANTFNINSEPTNNDSLTQVLVRDNLTGEVKYRDSATIGEGAGSVYFRAVSLDTSDYNTLTPLPIPWNGTNIKTDGITHSTGSTPTQVFVDEDGTYDLYSSFYWENDSGVIRSQIKLTVWVNGIQQNLVGEGQGGYARNVSGANFAMSHISTLLELNSGDYIEIKAERDGSSGTINQLANKSVFKLIKVQGIKGDAGPTGSISGNNNLFVTGTTYSDVYSGLTTEATYYGDGSNLTGIDAFTGYSNTIIVAKSGGDFTSLKSALDSATGSTLFNPTTIKVKGGTYLEDNMVIPEFTSVSTSDGVYIISNSTSGEFITFSDDSGWHGGTVLGPSGGTAFYSSDVQNSLVRECTIARGDVGVDVSVNSRMIVDAIFITTGVTTGIQSSFSSRVDGSNIINFANTIQFYANGGEIWMQNCASESSISGTTALYANNGGMLRALYTSINGPTTAILNGSVGVNDINLNGITIINSEKTIVQESVNGIIHIHHGDIEDETFDIINWNKIRIDYSKDIEGDLGYSHIGELSVGSIEKPSESIFGEGDSTSRGMLVYTEDNSNVFVNVSSAASSALGSTFALPNTSTNNALYISTDLKQDGLYYQFGGVKVLLDTITNLGIGDLVWEYWNGSSWIDLSVSMCGANQPYFQSRVKDFSDSSIGNAIQVRFDSNIYREWFPNDPISSGVNRYWVRLRISSDITSSPVFQQIKIHTNRTEINNDGWGEYFGKSRPIGALPWNASQLEASDSSPANQDIYISDSLSVGRVENNFASNAVNRVGFVSRLPQDLDTSTPIKLSWCWYSEGNSGGDVRWVIRWGYTNNGSNVYNTTAAAPTTGPNEQQIILIDSAPTVANVVKYSTVNLDVQGFISRFEGGFSDLIWCTIERTGNDAADTNTNDLVLVDILPNYTKWCDGGHESYNTYTELFSEDFESASLSAFTSVQDDTNVWTVGTATSSSGTYSAYITNDGGTSAAYTTTTLQVSHIYVDVAIPSDANLVKLLFDWRCAGEDGPGINQYDFGRVYATTTATTPTAGFILADTFEIGQGKYNSQTDWVGESIDLPATFIGSTVRLIFTWGNDTTVGNNPGFCIDNIVVRYI